jgi:hypothetical protein
MAFNISVHQSSSSSVSSAPSHRAERVAAGIRSSERATITRSNAAALVRSCWMARQRRDVGSDRGSGDDGNDRSRPCRQSGHWGGREYGESWHSNVRYV